MKDPRTPQADPHTIELAAGMSPPGEESADVSGNPHLHLRCFAAWELERESLKSAQQEASHCTRAHWHSPVTAAANLVCPSTSGSRWSQPLPRALHLLEGELWIDDRKLCPGDYNRAEPGTGDKRVWSETGCTCVLITSPADVLG